MPGRGKVIFVVPPEGRGRPTAGDDGGVRLGHVGALTELHAARNSQDASSQESESEAWIDDEEGSINVR